MNNINIDGYSEFEVLDSEIIVTHRAVLGIDEIEQLITEYTAGLCPVCLSDQFCDGDVICDRCYDNAIEEREKYR